MMNVVQQGGYGAQQPRNGQHDHWRPGGAGVPNMRANLMGGGQGMGGFDFTQWMPGQGLPQSQSQQSPGLTYGGPGGSTISQGQSQPMQGNADPNLYHAATGLGVRPSFINGSPNAHPGQGARFRADPRMYNNQRRGYANDANTNAYFSARRQYMSGMR